MPTPAAERVTCPRCHAPLQAPNAECAACLLALAVDAVDDAPPLDDARDERSRSAPAAPTPEELASDFPQLELLERVGVGGMGAVYRARHLALEREVAVKILSSALAADVRFAERFQREARALAKLDHPGIVRVHDFGRAGQRWYLIMEFVRGASLRRKLASGPLPPAEALAIVMQLADALEFAHARGVVHRDLKPENVLLDEQGRARLADFGLAKLLGDPLDPGRTETGVTLGTPPYMAPEQLTQPQDVDHRADLYALGVLFYELLTGKWPLGRFDLPSQRAGVPTQYDAAILKLLEREPQQRFQSAREAADALTGLTGAEAQVEPAARDDDEVDDREKGPQASARTTPQARVLIAAGVTVLASFCPWFTVNLPRRGSTWGDRWALHISVPEPSIHDVRFTVFSWNAWTNLLDVQWPLWLPAVIALFAALDSMLAARGNWRPHPRWCLALCSLALALVVQTLREADSPHTTYGIGSLASAGALLVLVWHYLALQLASWLPAFVKVDGPRVVRKPSRRRTSTRSSRTR